MESSPNPFREKALEPGEIAPEFELPDSTGSRQRLSDFCASNALVLVFYRGHW
jgi:peroxiredoxin